MLDFYFCLYGKWTETTIINITSCYYYQYYNYCYYCNYYFIIIIVIVW